VHNLPIEDKSFALPVDVRSKFFEKVRTWLTGA
jgi:hypothetical protein